MANDYTCVRWCKKFICVWKIFNVVNNYYLILAFSDNVQRRYFIALERYLMIRSFWLIIGAQNTSPLNDCNNKYSFIHLTILCSSISPRWVQNPNLCWLFNRRNKTSFVFFVMSVGVPYESFMDSADTDNLRLMFGAVNCGTEEQTIQSDWLGPGCAAA